MRSLFSGEPAAVLRYGTPILLAGMALTAVSSLCDTPGLITAVFAVGLGATAGALRNWRSERGLWMLAFLLLVLNCVIYGLMLIGQFGDLIRGVAQPELGVSIDVAFATLLLSASIRFVVRVGRSNFELSRGLHDT